MKKPFRRHLLIHMKLHFIILTFVTFNSKGKVLLFEKEKMIVII